MLLSFGCTDTAMTNGCNPGHAMESITKKGHSAAQTSSANNDLGVSFLRICVYCKNVRLPSCNRSGNWVTSEVSSAVCKEAIVFIGEGICPECYRKVVLPMIDHFKSQSESAMAEYEYFEIKDLIANFAF
jgi:hypothetical protein